MFLSFILRVYSDNRVLISIQTRTQLWKLIPLTRMKRLKRALDLLSEVQVVRFLATWGSGALPVESNVKYLIFVSIWRESFVY